MVAASVRRRSTGLVALALFVFPAGGQHAARRNAADAIKDDECRARLRRQAEVAMQEATWRSATGGAP